MRNINSPNQVTEVNARRRDIANASRRIHRPRRRGEGLRIKVNARDIVSEVRSARVMYDVRQGVLFLRCIFCGGTALYN